VQARLVQARFTESTRFTLPNCTTMPFCPSSTMKTDEKQTMAATAMTPIAIFFIY
jgi:hypothetical protein